MWVVILVGVWVAAALAHPHFPQDGECVAMRSLGPRQLWASPMPRCLGGVRPPKIYQEALKTCKKEVRKRFLSTQMQTKGDLLNSELVQGTVAAVGECLTVKLGLVAADGTLDTLAVVQLADKMEARDKRKVLYLRAIVRICAANTTSTNATEQLVEVGECVAEGAREVCDQRTALVRRWLQAEEEREPCHTVALDPQPQEACSECAHHLGVSTAVCGDVEEEEEGEEGWRGHPRRRGRHMNRRVNEEEEWDVRVCSSERMGWYTVGEGFDFQALSDTIANFTGWEDIPEELGNVTEAVVNCGPVYDGDAQTQAMMWTSCFLPKLFHTCGFRSNLTTLFFPGFPRKMEREVRRVMVEMFQLDEDDDDDEADAEMVDAGLLEEAAGLTEVEGGGQNVEDEGEEASGEMEDKGGKMEDMEGEEETVEIEDENVEAFIVDTDHPRARAAQMKNLGSSSPEEYSSAGSEDDTTVECEATDESLSQRTADMSDTSASAGDSSDATQPEEGGPGGEAEASTEVSSEESTEVAWEVTETTTMLLPQ